MQTPKGGGMARLNMIPALSTLCDVGLSACYPTLY
jgi:hypothetical protein